MGSSTASTSSNTTINTSTDSANTVATLVTVADGDSDADAAFLDDVLAESLPVMRPPASDIARPSTSSVPGAPPPTPLLGACQKDQKFIFVQTEVADDDTASASTSAAAAADFASASRPRGSVYRPPPRPPPTPPPDLRVDFFPESAPDASPTSEAGAGGEGGGGGAGAVTGRTRAVVHTTANPLAALAARGAGPGLQPQGTAVVVQASGPPATVLLRAERRGTAAGPDHMRQLLDVCHTLTQQELHDFEMKYGSPHHSRSQSVKLHPTSHTSRYGSPHHSRSQSVKTPGSRSNAGRPNYLCLPQQRSRVASMPNTGVEEEYYRLRHFSITGKGVVNRGDSLKARRSRSNTSVGSSNSSHSTEHLTAAAPGDGVVGRASQPGSARTSATASLASSRESSTSQPGPTAPFRVLMLGGAGTGKTSIVSQFMTSEYLHAYDTSLDDECGEKSVSVLLDGGESELSFTDPPAQEPPVSPEQLAPGAEPHAYCVVYSVVDRASFRQAEELLQRLWKSDSVSSKAVILVANKTDLVRSRTITTDEGKNMATSYDCKFIETSVAINHNVDELLVGVLTQIRLKLENPERARDLFRKRSHRRSRKRSPLGPAAAPGGPPPSAVPPPGTPPAMGTISAFGCKPCRGTRTSASLKVKGLLGRVWARDSKSKSCENLHVL